MNTLGILPNAKFTRLARMVNEEENQTTRRNFAFCFRDFTLGG